MKWQECVGGEIYDTFAKYATKSNCKVAVARKQAVMDQSIGFELPFVHDEAGTNRSADQEGCEDMRVPPRVY